MIQCVRNVSELNTLGILPKYLTPYKKYHSTYWDFN